MKALVPLAARLVWLCLLALAVQANSSFAHAQMPGLPKIEQFGIDGLRLMLQQQGLSATQTQVETALTASDETVVVIVGDMNTASKIAGQLDAFVHNGGALLLAADLLGQKTPNTRICGSWFRSIGFMNNTQGKQFGFRKLHDCPMVTRFDRENAGQLFEGVDTIVTNRPARAYTSKRRTVRTIAWLPYRDYPLMLMTERGEGRMLLVADHSIFINEMLVHGDNARFVSNVTSWLCEGGNRSNLVLVHDGKVLPNWGFGDTPPAIPLETLLKAVQASGLSNLPIGDTLIPIANDAIYQAQRRNAFNEAALQASRYVFGARPNRWLVIISSIVGLIAIGWFSGARWRPHRWLSFQDWSQPTEPRMVGAIREGQYFPYLRSLTREFFRESGATQFDLESPPKNKQSQSSAQKKTHELWRIASGDAKRLTKKDFDQHMAVLRELRQLQLAGDLSLQWPQPTKQQN